MPSLRDSGKIIGGSVSIKQMARQCNLSFPLSLRHFISVPGCPFSRCNRLHLKVVTEPNIAIETMLARMREIYATAGIRIEVVSRENLTGTEFNTLDDLDVGDCAGTTTDEQNQLFENQNNVAAGQRGNEIVVYFVRSVVKTDSDVLNGCAAHPDGRPAAVVAQIASQWTLAHEVGHVLGLDHISGEEDDTGACVTPDPTRLMTGCSTSNITDTPTFDQGEIDRMTSSNLIPQC